MTSIYGVRPLMTHRRWSLWQRPLMMPVVLSEWSDARVALSLPEWLCRCPSGSDDARVALIISERSDARVAVTMPECLDDDRHEGV
jgi:hypothetical protein